MRVLLAVLLVGIVGCGGGEETSPGDAATPSSPASSPVKSENAEAGAPPFSTAVSPVKTENATVGASKAKADKSPAQTAVEQKAAAADAVAALEKLATILRNDKGEVVILSLELTKVTDADLVHLKEHTKLTHLVLGFTAITDAGLTHLKGLTNLKVLYVTNTKVTDAGIAELKKALPNCKSNR